MTKATGAPASGKRSRKKNGPAAARKKTTARVLLRELRRRRHRAAILDCLANEAVSLFSSAFGDEPKYAIGDGNLNVELADTEVVMAVAHELTDGAEREKDYIRSLIEMDLTKAFRYWGQMPEKTAGKILQGVRKNKGLLLPTIDAKIFYFLKRFFPGLSAAISLLAARKLAQLRAVSE